MYNFAHIMRGCWPGNLIRMSFASQVYEHRVVVRGSFPRWSMAGVIGLGCWPGSC